MDEKPAGEERPEGTPPGDREPDAGDSGFDAPLRLSREAEFPPEEAPPDRSGTMTVVVIAAVILIGAAAVLWWWFGSRGASQDAEAPVEPPPPAAGLDAAGASEDAEGGEPPTPAPEPPPDLAGSDSLVRDVVGGLSRHAGWAAWLVPEELVVNFVRAVGAVAYDEPPQGSLEPLRPEDGFSVVRRGQRFYPAETSYRRYDLAVEVFDSIDVAGVAGAWERLEPLLERAHDELGYPAEFGDTLELAVTKLLRTPAPESPPELRLRVISFEYVDPALESLSPAQKLLLRLGPDNDGRVRNKVRELYAALE